MWYESNDHLRYQLPYAPHWLYADLQTARRRPSIESHLPNDPWEPGGSVLSASFWEVARTTPFYEDLLNHGVLLVQRRSKRRHGNPIGKLFPVGSPMRAYLTKLFPYDSRRAKAVKAALRKLHLR